MKRLLTFQTSTRSMGLDLLNSRPNLDRITSIRSQLTLLLVVLSINLRVLKVVSKLSYPQATSKSCPQNNLLTIKLKIHKIKIFKQVEHLYRRAKPAEQTM